MPENTTTEIIILRYKNREYEDETIQSVLTHTDPEKTPYHLTVYDNQNGKGVAWGWNKTISRTDANIVCLLNSDTVVEKGWLEKLLKNFPEYDMVGPITNKCGTHQTGHSKSDRSKATIPSNTLSGFCLLFKKEWWDKYKFNEDYYMYAEETEWLDKCRKGGAKLGTDLSVHVFHYGGATAKLAQKNGLDITKIKKESQQKYAENKSRMR